MVKIPNPFGWGIPKIPLDEFSVIFSHALQQVEPASVLTKDLQTPGEDDWKRSTAMEAIACRTHLVEACEPAHNALNAVKPEHCFGSLHRSAMLASRAYGETLFAYIEYSGALIAAPMDEVVRLRQDGREWDELAEEHSRKLVEALEEMELREPDAIRSLLPAGIPDGLRAIAAGPPLGHLMPGRTFGAVANFGA